MEERKLYRSRTDRMVAGVCGGVAEYFGVDPSIVRILAVVLGVIGNAAIVIVYVVCWIVVPEEPVDASQQQAQPGAGTSAVPVAAAPAAPVATGAEDVAHVTDSVPEPPAQPAPQPTPQPAVTAPATPYAPPASASHEQRGVRTGLVWFGILLIVLGGALLADRVFPGVDIWGFWPATLIGVLFIVSGIRTMVTSGGDGR